MAAGLLIFPGAYPSRDRQGNRVAAQIGYYENGAPGTPKTVYADIGLTIPLGVGGIVHSDALGNFPSVYADTAERYTGVWSTADGQSLTLDDLSASTAANQGIYDATVAARDQTLIYRDQTAVLKGQTQDALDDALDLYGGMSAVNAAVTAAAGSATAANASKLAAEAAYDSFDDRYLGAKSTPPTTDNDGNALLVGAIYYNDGTVVPASQGNWTWTGAAWQLGFASTATLVAKSGDKMTGPLEFATIPTIASAGTTNLGAATSNLVTVSGTTTITSFGTIAAGAERQVYFSGILTLTNSANLILPGGADILTAAGDNLRARSEGGGVWRVTSYQRASGASVTLSTAAILRNPQTGAGYTILPSDRGKMVDLSNASAQTLALTAAATLGPDFFCYLNIGGAGAWTIDPNGSETVNGAATYPMYTHETAILIGNGTAFFLYLLNREGGRQVHAQCQGTSGVDGTTTVATTWMTPTINTLVHNTGGASLASSLLTLGPGVWDIWARVPVSAAGLVGARIYNVTDSTVAGYGASAGSGNSASFTADVWMYARVTLTAAKAFSPQIFPQSAGGKIGTANGNGNPEIYTEIWAERVF